MSSRSTYNAIRPWLALLIAAVFISGSMASEYVGCYPLSKKLGARLPVPKLDLGGCLAACRQHRGSPYVAYRNAQICYCLSTLAGLSKLQDKACPSKCWRDPPTTTRTCGGKTSVSVYSTDNSQESSGGLVIETENGAYSPGDMLFANCSYNLPATLVFYVNDIPVATSDSSSGFVDPGPGPSSLPLSLLLLPSHFNKSQLTLTCSAIVVGLNDHIVTEVQLGVMENDSLSDKILVEETTLKPETTPASPTVSLSAMVFVLALLVPAVVFLALLVKAWWYHRPGEKLRFCFCSTFNRSQPDETVGYTSK